jgi:aspartate carbamoyltransferase catalytic subunit
MLHIFKLIRELKRALQANNQSSLGKFAVNTQQVDAHTIFTEKSTRTLQSFSSALSFHQARNSLFRVNPFRADASSFAKSESWEDTINTLVGYTEGYIRSLFIIRSKLEGTCR